MFSRSERRQHKLNRGAFSAGRQQAKLRHCPSAADVMCERSHRARVKMHLQPGRKRSCSRDMTILNQLKNMRMEEVDQISR